MEQLVEKRSYKCLMTCGRNDRYNPYLAVSCIHLLMVLIVPLCSIFIGYFVSGKIQFSAQITEYQDGIVTRAEVNITLRLPRVGAGCSNC